MYTRVHVRVRVRVRLDARVGAIARSVSLIRRVFRHSSETGGAGGRAQKIEQNLFEPAGVVQDVLLDDGEVSRVWKRRKG